MAKKTSQLKLAAEKRKLLGRQVKKLRREGVLPANVYGKKVKSLAVKLPVKEFFSVYEQGGETSLVKLAIKGERKVRPVLVHNVQFDPVTDQPLHVDFHQVDLKTKVTTEVPIELVGEAPAVEQKMGILIQPLNEVEVEALPTDLPDEFELDISNLKKVDDAISVAELSAPKGVEILTGEKQILVKINPLAEEEKVVSPPTTEMSAEEDRAEEAPAGEKEEKQKEQPSEGVQKEESEKKENETKETQPAKK